VLEAIECFVRQDSEGGRRAQAIVAGLMDVVCGDERVISGRFNDPSRHFPGDVCVLAASDGKTWEKAIEVRDKPVSESDIENFTKACIDKGAREAACVMVHADQRPVDAPRLGEWANGFGVGLTLFIGWRCFLTQALFWAQDPVPVAAEKAFRRIRERLIAVEVSPDSLVQWDKHVVAEAVCSKS
jgi:hypothetical protein